MGMGEPLNAIISGNSDSRVLVNADVDGGLLNYFMFVAFLAGSFVPRLIDLLASISRSFGFSGECLGQHSGSDQAANLGDGNGSSVYFSFPHATSSYNCSYHRK